MPDPFRCAAAVAASLAVAACAAPRPPVAASAPAPGAEHAATAADWSRAARLEVVLDEYAFRPERLALRQGEPVVLRLVNRGRRGHDFTAPAFFAAAAARAGDTAAAAARAAGGSVDVPAGEAREVAVVPLAPGTYPLDCDKPLHGTFGMTGEIVVAPRGT